MHRALHRSPAPRRARGFGLAEILVGVTIGLLALLIVYQVLGLSEGYRRTTTAGGDAQSSGMISSFILAGDIAGSGHTVSESQQELASCPNSGAFATTWRPIPVLIEDGGADDVSDAFSLYGGSNKRLVSSLEIVNNYNPGGTIDVQSPFGFQRSNATESAHLFIIADTLTGRCEVARISPWPAPLDPVTGYTTLTPSPSFTQTYLQGQSWVINLGPFDRVRKVRYDMQGDVLRRTDLVPQALGLAASAPNPIASNIVLMKAQYGVDTDGNGFVDTWTNARNAPWRQADVLAAPIGQLRQIKAVRIALVVRSAQFERQLDAEGRPVVGAAALAADFTTTLFPCNGIPACTGEMPVTIPGSANFRHRVFQQVVPITNQIWNPS